MRHVALELAAHHAGVDRATIRQWVRRRHITRYADGYDLAEITRWIESRNARMADLAKRSHAPQG